MTALEEILHAEKEAEASIVLAKEVKLKAQAAAKTEREASLKQQAFELQNMAEAELRTCKERLTEKVIEIEKNTATEVNVIETKFSDRQTALMALVKGNI